MQDAEALRDEQQVPDRIEQRHRALDLGRGHSLALDGGELQSKLGHAQLEVVAALVELGQVLGGHVAAAGSKSPFAEVGKPTSVELGSGRVRGAAYQDTAHLRPTCARRARPAPGLETHTSARRCLAT